MVIEETKKKAFPHLVTRRTTGCSQYTFKTSAEYAAWCKRHPYRNERVVLHLVERRGDKSFFVVGRVSVMAVRVLALLGYLEMLAPTLKEGIECADEGMLRGELGAFRVPEGVHAGKWQPPDALALGEAWS